MIHYITTQGIGQPWVGNELHAVQLAGVPFRLHALRAPSLKYFESDWGAALARDTKVLYPLPPLGLLASIFLAPFLFGTRFFTALGNALFGKRESFRARIATIAHLAVACHWARSLRHEPVSHIHAQWIHSSGSVGMYGAWLLGKTFSFTGHAADLFRDRVALEDKVRRADFIVCISEFHRDLFKQLGARDEQLRIVYCGIDLEHFVPLPREARPASRPPHVISSGRLVEKKGFEYLIDACKILADRGLDFTCTIGGSGPLESALKQRIQSLNLTDRVTVTGKEITQDALPRFMQHGDIYCLPCVWASDGDVDGLPQMLMEAMACGLPGISTKLVGIPDLIIDGKTGLLVEPRHAQQAADAIERLIKDPAFAASLAAAGRKWIYEKFDLRFSSDPLIHEFRLRLKDSQPASTTSSRVIVEPAPGPTPLASGAEK